jgi:hypothetical protein
VLINGLELSEKYFFECGLPMIKDAAPEIFTRCAAGLAGPGSECLGFDDELSRDHDWGPGFCLWLTDEDFAEYGEVLARKYELLPKEFEGLGPRTSSPGEEFRIGVMSASSFFKRYSGTSEVPRILKEWMIPPENLGLCTNGRVFHDPSGFFTGHRRRLTVEYPESLRIKRIAACALNAGQAGQYNLPRSLGRGESYAALHDLARFCDAVLKLVFLLNRSFPPYYKWLHRAASPLPVLGSEVSELVGILSGRRGFESPVPVIEEFCRLVVFELEKQKLTVLHDNFLAEQAIHINERLDNEELIKYPFQYF